MNFLDCKLEDMIKITVIGILCLTGLSVGCALGLTPTCSWSSFLQHSGSVCSMSDVVITPAFSLQFFKMAAETVSWSSISFSWWLIGWASYACFKEREGYICKRCALLLSSNGSTTCCLPLFSYSIRRMCTEQEGLWGNAACRTRWWTAVRKEKGLHLHCFMGEGKMLLHSQQEKWLFWTKFAVIKSKNQFPI